MAWTTFAFLPPFPVCFFFFPLHINLLLNLTGRSCVYVVITKFGVHTLLAS